KTDKEYFNAKEHEDQQKNKHITVCKDKQNVTNEQINQKRVKVVKKKPEHFSREQL
ncbi:14256_t:CDS:1, partial [Gigaspora rosea]